MCDPRPKHPAPDQSGASMIVRSPAMRPTTLIAEAQGTGGEPLLPGTEVTEAGEQVA